MGNQQTELNIEQLKKDLLDAATAGAQQALDTWMQDRLSCGSCILITSPEELERVRDFIHITKEIAPKDIRENLEYVQSVRMGSNQIKKALITTGVGAALMFICGLIWLGIKHKIGS